MASKRQSNESIPNGQHLICVVSAANFANVNNNGNANYNNASNSNGVRPDSLSTDTEGDVVRSKSLYLD